MSDQEATRTAHVGPIIFGNEIARRQLVENGEVVSFRTSERTTGETWWRETRTGPKRGDVIVEHVGKATTPFDLAEYVELSGFDSVDDWQDAIKEVHGESAVEGHLYRVTEGHND